MSGEHNPYAAPAPAAVEISFLRDQPRPKRPIAVWLMLLLLFGTATPFLLSAASLVWLVISNWDGIRNGPALAATLALRLAVPAALVLTGFAVYARKPWSRWVGAALLLAYAFASVLRPDTTHYANEAQRAGGHLARTFIIPPLFAWWCYAFAFTAKARRYFTKTVAGPV